MKTRKQKVLTVKMPEWLCETDRNALRARVLLTDTDQEVFILNPECDGYDIALRLSFVLGKVTKIYEASGDIKARISLLDVQEARHIDSATHLSPVGYFDKGDLSTFRLSYFTVLG